MSHEKIKNIKIENNKVMINGASNNVRPLSYSYWECVPLSKILQEKGQEEVDIAILKDYESGEFQGGSNKYTRALEVLYYVFKEEYKKFDWRDNWEESKKTRETEEFKELLKKVLNTKLPKKRFILSKIYNSYDYVGEIYLRKYISSAYWTREKSEAKKFRFKEELENIKSYFRDSENWEILEVGK